MSECSVGADPSIEFAVNLQTTATDATVSSQSKLSQARQAERDGAAFFPRDLIVATRFGLRTMHQILRTFRATPTPRRAVCGDFCWCFKRQKYCRRRPHPACCLRGVR